jgi:predicted dehydrogenase
LIRVAALGYGNWGPTVVRRLRENPNVEVVAIADLDGARLAQARADAPGVPTSPDAFALLEDIGVDAVAIMTPVCSHYELAARALSNGKHVLVEKPLAASSSEARALVDLAETNRLSLLVGHTVTHMPAADALRDLVRECALGEVRYVDSVRVGRGLVRSDTDVVWDLAIHELALLRFVLGSVPVDVCARGADPSGNGRVSLAHLDCTYPSGVPVHLHVSWLSPVRARRIVIGGTDRTVLYDDDAPSGELRLFDGAFADYRQPPPVGGSPPFVSRPLEERSALATQIEHFVACVRGESDCRDDARGAADLIDVLEAAARSMQRDGAREAV